MEVVNLVLPYYIYRSVCPACLVNANVNAVHHVASESGCDITLSMFGAGSSEVGVQSVHMTKQELFGAGKCGSVKQMVHSYMYGLLCRTRHPPAFLRSRVVSSKQPKLGLTQELSFSRITESTTGYTFTPCVGSFTSPSIDTR